MRMCNIRNPIVRIILLINFLFTICYYGPSMFMNCLNFIHFLSIVALDEIYALLFFDLQDLQKYCSVDIQSLLQTHNNDEYKKALTFAHNPPNQFKYIYNGFPPCSRDVQMLILIKSAVNNIALRQAMRVSLGQTGQRKFHTRFLLGFNSSLQRLVATESTIYRDIIQKDFEDSYVNNTYKTIMGFDWAVRYCSNAKFILFVDDDHYIDKNGILAFVRSLPKATKESLFIGMRVDSRPDRNLGSKWYVSWSDYPYPRYPSYLVGGAYVVSQSAASKLLSVFPFIKYFWVDDVWLGLAAMLTGITPIGDPKFYNLNYATDVEDRFLLHCKSHKPGDIIAAWERATSSHANKHIMLPSKVSTPAHMN